MSLTVEFHFDFGSPNTYLCHKVIPDVIARTGVEFAYVPILLGGVFKLTNNSAPMVQFKDIKNKNEFRRVETERFIRRHGVTEFNMNPHFPINTVPLMRGALLAQRDGYFAPYVDAVYHHMWEAPKKIDDLEVLKSALDQSGVDGAAVLAGIQEQAIKDQLVANTNKTVERGNFGSPTFFVGDEMFFGKDQLRDVEDEIRARIA